MSNQDRFSFFSNIPPVTKNLIIINFLCWLASLVMPKMGIDMIQWCGLHFPGVTDFHFFQIFTYMFMHDTHSFEHIFFNMFAVYMFGRSLESIWGGKRFLLFYMVSGLGAGLVQELVWWYMIHSDAVANGVTVARLIAMYPAVNGLVTIGASGAVFGILLAFGMVFPNIPLYIMFIPIPIKAKYFVIGYCVVELFLGVASFSGDNVAHFAHLGGMLFGLILLLYWKKRGILYFKNRDDDGRCSRY